MQEVKEHDPGQPGKVIDLSLYRNRSTALKESPAVPVIGVKGGRPLSDEATMAALDVVLKQPPPTKGRRGSLESLESSAQISNKVPKTERQSWLSLRKLFRQIFS